MAWEGGSKINFLPLLFFLIEIKKNYFAKEAGFIPSFPSRTIKPI